MELQKAQIAKIDIIYKQDSQNPNKDRNLRYIFCYQSYGFHLICFWIQCCMTRIHTVINLFVILFQRGNQRVSMVCKVLVGLAWLFAIVALFVAVFKVITWFMYLYFFSYIKLAVTLIKYVPQVSCLSLALL